MKYLVFYIVDDLSTYVDDHGFGGGHAVVPLLEDMTPEEIIQRILAVAPKVVSLGRVPPQTTILSTDPILEIPKEDTEARTADARKRDPWVDPNPEETQRRKATLTEKDVMSGSRVTAVDEGK